MPPDPNVHVGVCGWVQRHDEVLLIQRVGVGEYASDGHGTWSLPGGWLETGESPLVAVEREVFEETGLVVRATNNEAWVWNRKPGGFDVVTLVINCVDLGGEPSVTEPDKCADVGFRPIGDLARGLPLFAPLESYLHMHPEVLDG